MLRKAFEKVREGRAFGDLPSCEGGQLVDAESFHIFLAEDTRGGAAVRKGDEKVFGVFAAGGALARIVDPEDEGADLLRRGRVVGEIQARVRRAGREGESFAVLKDGDGLSGFGKCRLLHVEACAGDLLDGDLVALGSRFREGELRRQGRGRDCHKAVPGIGFLIAQIENPRVWRIVDGQSIGKITGGHIFFRIFPRKLPTGSFRFREDAFPAVPVPDLFV